MPAWARPPSDVALLGAVTLEALGLILNPLTRQVLPMRLLLARMAPRAPRLTAGRA